MDVNADEQDRQPAVRPPHKPTGASLVAVIGVVVAVLGITVLHTVGRTSIRCAT